MSSDLLTDDEHAAVKMAADLFTHVVKNVINTNDPLNNDIAELALHVHGIQNMVLAQAAARVYPDQYRLLGKNL